MIISLLCLIITCLTVADPDLQIRGGAVSKKFFSSLRALACEA